MRRLRDLGLSVGELPTGPLNAIIDVEGVRVGHACGAVGGITVVVPFPDIPRRYYAGRWSLDGGDDTTALAMLEDFGALSTPIALAPAPAVGRVYDGFLDYGFSHSAGLGEDEGWPPAVILALSAHVLPEYAGRIRDAGMDGQLIKPLTLSAMQAALHQYLTVDS